MRITGNFSTPLDTPVLFACATGANNAIILARSINRLIEFKVVIK